MWSETLRCWVAGMLGCWVAPGCSLAGAPWEYSPWSAMGIFPLKRNPSEFLDET